MIGSLEPIPGALAQPSHRPQDMMFEYCVIVLKILTVGLAAGGIAEFLLRTDLSESWIAVGGLLGVAVDHSIPINWGPDLFGYCLLSCVAASAIVMIVLSLLHLPLTIGTRVLRPQRKRAAGISHQRLHTTAT